MNRDELTGEELEYIDREANQRLEELILEHEQRAQASIQIGEATRATILDRELVDVSESIQTLVRGPEFEEAHSHEGSEMGGEYTSLGNDFGRVTQALPITVPVILYVRDSAPFTDVHSHTRVTAAAWADANTDSKLRSGNLGGDCGFFVPGGEGWVSTWVNFGPLTPNPKAKTLVVGVRANITLDQFVVSTLGYANAVSKIELTVYDVVHKTRVIYLRLDKSSGWAVIGGNGAQLKYRYVNYFQSKVKPGGRYVTQFRQTQSCGGGGLIVGGHNKDQLSDLALDFIQLK